MTLNTQLPYNLATAQLGTYQKNEKSHSHKNPYANVEFYL